MTVFLTNVKISVLELQKDMKESPTISIYKNKDTYYPFLNYKQLSYKWEFKQTIKPGMTCHSLFELLYQVRNVNAVFCSLVYIVERLLLSGYIDFYFFNLLWSSIFLLFFFPTKNVQYIFLLKLGVDKAWPFCFSFRNDYNFEKYPKIILWAIFIIFHMFIFWWRRVDINTNLTY